MVSFLVVSFSMVQLHESTTSWVWVKLHEFEYVQLHKFEYSFMSLSTASWVWVQLHEIEFSFMSRVQHGITCSYDHSTRPIIFTTKVPTATTLKILSSWHTQTQNHQILSANSNNVKHFFKFFLVILKHMLRNYWKFLKKCLFATTCIAMFYYPTPHIQLYTSNDTHPMTHIQLQTFYHSQLLNYTSNMQRKDSLWSQDK